MNKGQKSVSKNRCGILLAMLFVNLMIHPFVSEGGIGGIVIGILSTCVVLSAVYAVASGRHVRIVIGLAIFAIAATWLAHIAPSNTTWILNELTDVFIFVYIVVIFLIYVLGRGEVTADKLMAAVCIYLILGFIWARAYNTIEILVPGSFANVPSEPYLARDQLIYYSFVTLTTLGYGDISPVKAAARSLSIVQATFGVLYIAVLVSRLAGQFRQEDESEN